MNGMADSKENYWWDLGRERVYKVSITFCSSFFILILVKADELGNPFTPKVLFSNSSYCLSHNSYDVSLEN